MRLILKAAARTDEQSNKQNLPRFPDTPSHRLGRAHRRRIPPFNADTCPIAEIVRRASKNNIRVREPARSHPAPPSGKNADCEEVKTRGLALTGSRNYTRASFWAILRLPVVPANAFFWGVVVLGRRGGSHNVRESAERWKSKTREDISPAGFARPEMPALLCNAPFCKNGGHAACESRTPVSREKGRSWDRFVSRARRGSPDLQTLIPRSQARASEHSSRSCLLNRRTGREGQTPRPNSSWVTSRRTSASRGQTAHQRRRT